MIGKATTSDSLQRHKERLCSPNLRACARIAKLRFARRDRTRHCDATRCCASDQGSAWRCTGQYRNSILTFRVAAHPHRRVQRRRRCKFLPHARVVQALDKLKNRSHIQVVDDVISAAPKILSQVMKTANVRISDDDPVAIKMTVKGGVGVFGAVCLGWANTDGFHMVGVRGSVSASIGVGGDMVVGRHATKPQVKCILGLPNVCIELVFENVSQPQKIDTAGPDDPGDGVEVDEVSKDALAMTL